MDRDSERELLLFLQKDTLSEIIPCIRLCGPVTVIAAGPVRRSCQAVVTAACAVNAALDQVPGRDSTPI